MKLLLTSAGLTNKSIINALQKLVQKPFPELTAAFIPTAAYAEKVNLEWLEEDIRNIKNLGIKDLEIMNIAVLSPQEVKGRLEKVDIIFVGGGNCFYLSYWMQKSDLLDLLPELLKIRVYVGISAGSMVVTDNLGVSSQALEKSELLDEEYDELGPKGESSLKTAKLANFVIRPHLNSKWFPKIRLDFLSEVAKDISETMYAIDDQTAISVVDGKVEVVSEGEWKRFN